MLTVIIAETMMTVINKTKQPRNYSRIVEKNMKNTRKDEEEAFDKKRREE